MKKENKKIGVLDMNIDSIHLINAIRNRFKNDDIYYINDHFIETYEGLDIDDIKKYVSNNLSYLLTKNIDILVVANDTIIEYCEDLFTDLQIPVINIVSETINYVNKNYEYKNLGFLACSSIIEANIYQKNFRYNHLYNMNGDDLKDLIRTHLVKTTESFQEAKNVIVPVYKKDLDLIIPSLINFLMVNVEINEWLKDVPMLPIDEIICDLIQDHLYPNTQLDIKGKGNTYICVKENMDNKFLSRYIKSKFIVINTEEEKQNETI